MGIQLILFGLQGSQCVVVVCIISAVSVVVFVHKLTILTPLTPAFLKLLGSAASRMIFTPSRSFAMRALENGEHFRYGSPHGQAPFNSVPSGLCRGLFRASGHSDLRHLCPRGWRCPCNPARCPSRRGWFTRKGRLGFGDGTVCLYGLPYGLVALRLMLGLTSYVLLGMVFAHARPVTAVVIVAVAHLGLGSARVIE
jgi:hypothetical protein